MKNLSLIAALIIVLLLLPMAASKSEEPSAKRKITVTGTAEIKVKPDLVTFNVGVETTNANLSQAKFLNDESIKQIISIAKKFNIPEKMLKTNYLNITPHYQNYKDKTIKDYQVKNFITIELTDISILDSLISAFIDVGVTNIFGIDFKSSEPRKYKDEARELAIKTAKEKAEQMANVLGMKIGKALDVKDNINYDENNYFNRSSYSNIVLNDVDADSVPEESVTQKGEIIIKASVTITFEME